MNKTTFPVFLLLFVFLTNSFSQNKVGPLMTSSWQTFQWPLNGAFPECNPGTYGEVNGHLGNSCGPTAIAKLLHFHRHPVHGEGTYSMTDEFNISHSFDFDNTYFKWTLMKDQFPLNPDMEDYMPTADLVYYAYGMMEDPPNTGRSLYDVGHMLKKYMRYSSSAYVAYRFDYSREDYINLLKTELNAGRPLLIESWTADSNPPGSGGNHAGHYWNIDGYDEQDRFHSVLNNGNIEVWIDIDSMKLPDFDAYYIWALIQAKPDETVKKIGITIPEKERMFKLNETVSLTWEQQNIEELNIDVSYGDGEWINIGDNIQAEQGQWIWDGPDQASKELSFRFRDANNEYYEFYFDEFESYEQKQLKIVTPVDDDKYESGSKMCLAWEYDGIYELQFEAKESGSEDWQIINRKLNAKDKFNIWPIPSESGMAYDFRLSNSDGSFVDLVENVMVEPNQQTGGPYRKDYYTLLLMHFDNNFNEEAYLAQVIIEGEPLSFDYSVGGKGAALVIDNSERSNMSYLEIPDEEFLSLRGSFTIDLWFKINSWDDLNVNKPLIIGKPAMGTRVNYSLIGNANKGNVVFKIRTTDGDVKLECKEGIIIPGIWYHVAMIHDVNTREVKLLLHNDKKEKIDEQSSTYNEGAGIVIGNSNLMIGKKVVGSTYLDGCIDEIRISATVRDFSSVWSGINDVREDNNIKINIYPNPVSECINITIVNSKIDIKKIRIIDALGQVVNEVRRDDLEIQTDNIIINTSSLKTGVYYLVIGTEKGRIVEKIVIKR